MQKEIKSIVNTEYVSWLLYLPRGIDQLKKLGELKKYPADCLLAAAGTYTRYCYVVVSGRVISSEYSESGEERIYSVNEKDSLILEENLLFGYKVPVNIRTITETEVVRINRSSLAAAIQGNPSLAMDILQSLSIKYLSSVEQMKCINEHSAVQKVCNLLLNFAERYGDEENGSIVIREKLSQEYISSLLGLNRITVVRVMKELKEQGLVEKKKGYYYLHNVEQMQESLDEKWA